MSEQCEALRPRTETKKKHDYAAMGRKRIMFKFIIVDDEKIIRSGLAKSFDWSSIGFEPVEQFEDGKEAIEYLKSLQLQVQVWSHLFSCHVIFWEISILPFSHA